MEHLVDGTHFHTWQYLHMTGSGQMGARYCETCGEAHQQTWRTRPSTEKEKEMYNLFWKNWSGLIRFSFSMHREDEVMEICWVRVPKDLILENRRSYSQGPADSEKEWNKAMVEGEIVSRLDDDNPTVV